MFENEYGAMSGDAVFQRPLSVTEVNTLVKEIFDGLPPFRDITVEGEISNFKNHFATGHFYFSLKDSSSAIKAVMFRSDAVRMKFMPENGMKVSVHGRITAFVRDGQYQLYADRMEPQGKGALYAAYEQLKNKLAAEGLFDESLKKPIPKFPKTVGVVTSSTGAAVRDIINVLGRRYPAAKVLLYPCLVQGESATDSIISGIEYFNDRKCADVLIIGRGGGSIEDLWAFNSEKLARVIYASQIPVISAVGHETDYTISDFVSDVRAPTPSAAAEIAVPDIQELKMNVSVVSKRLENLVGAKIEKERMRLSRFSSSRVLVSPTIYIDDRKMYVARLFEQLSKTQSELIVRKNEAFKSKVRLLSSLNPLNILSRGYSAAFDEKGNIIKQASDVKIGEKIKIKTGGGSIGAVVSEIGE